ncbi:MAG: tail fiber domain-containing protein [Gelidibacter sp.]
MKTKILYFFLLTSIYATAQIGIGTTDPKAVLDIKATNQANPLSTDGMLVPKIDIFPATNPGVDQQGMLVYLTTTVGANSQGFYYWDNPTTTWIPIGNNNNSGWGLNGNIGTNPALNFIGTTDGQDVVFKRNNILSGKIATSNTSFGFASLLTNPSGSTAFGNTALQQNSGNNNSGFGNQVLRATGNGGFNSGFGANAMRNNTSGTNNTGIGFEALLTNTSGNDNTSVGYKADVSSDNLSNATAIGAKSLVGADNSLVLGSINGVNGSTANVNVGIGTTTPNNKLQLNSPSPLENVFLQFSNAGTGTGPFNGFLVGINSSGEGGLVNFSHDSMTFQTLSGEVMRMNAGNVGIGVNTPLDKLHVIGNIRMVDGNQAAGRVMTSDVNGRATWQNASANAWGLTGNTGTNAVSNFIGTSDDVDLVFRRNNLVHGRLGFSNTSFGRNTNIAGSGNSAFGMNAMSGSNTNSGCAFGSDALVFATGGSNNAFGSSSLFRNTSGSENSAFGTFSLNQNTTGIQNSAFGNKTLANNTTGSSNIGIGYAALNNNTVGDNNTAVGYEALVDNVSSNSNTAIGHFALRRNSTGTVNTALGASALNSNTTGTSNTAAGGAALSANTTGSFNSAFGRFALFRSPTGFSNSAFGYQSQQNTTSGQSNSSFGELSMNNNTTGGFNTAMGRQALRVNDTGGFNTAFGALSDVSVGNLTNATAIGARAEVGASNSLVLGSINGINGATSSVNVGIGTTTPNSALQVEGTVTFNDNADNVDFRVESLTEPNMLRVDASDDAVKIGTIGATTSLLRVGDVTGDGIQIGSAEVIEDGGVSILQINSNLLPSTDNVRDLGSPTLRWDDVFATSGVVNTSDRNTKTNISPLNYGLNEILQLNPVTFNWKDKPNGKRKIGFIAQELLPILNEVVKTEDTFIDEDGQEGIIKMERLGVYYSDIIPVLVKGMQEQQALIESLQKRIDELEKKQLHKN